MGRQHDLGASDAAGAAGAAGAAPGPVRVGVAIATRERRADLERTLARLLALPERPAVCVVDNGSADGTPAAIRARFPQVDVVELGEKRGAPARHPARAGPPTPHGALRAAAP